MHEMASTTNEKFATAVTILAGSCTISLAALLVWRELVTQRPSVIAQEDRIVPQWHDFRETGHRVGSATAPVTVLEFGDYQCPACKRFYATFVAVQRVFGEGQVALVYRHFPLEQHPMAYTAARAAICAGYQERFSEYHTLLYTSVAWQGIGSRSFEQYAEQAGVPDRGLFEQCLFSVDNVPEIEADLEAAVRLGITGTPTIIVNDQLIGGVPDSARLHNYIAKALERRLQSSNAAIR